MLSASAPFPFPGAICQLDGVRFKILRHQGEDEALLAREGTRASFTRRAKIADLIDPDLVDGCAAMWLASQSVDTKKIALFIARHLRDANTVAFAELASTVRHAVIAQTIPILQDMAQIAQILTALGWQKIGEQGEAWNSTSLWSRSAAA